MGKRILIIDDEQDLFTALKRKLQQAGFIIFVSAPADNLLKHIQELKPDLIILGDKLRKEAGFDNAALMQS